MDEKDGLILIYTNPQVKSLKGVHSISQTLFSWGSLVCLSYVDKDFNPTEEEMVKVGMDMWWQVMPSQITEALDKITDFGYDLEDGEINIVDVIENVFNLTKEQNIAYVLYTLFDELNCDPYERWNRWSDSVNGG